jgi:hypothetical protein
MKIGGLWNTREMVGHLERAGCSHVRTNGTHQTWQAPPPHSDRRILVAYRSGGRTVDRSQQEDVIAFLDQYCGVPESTWEGPKAKIKRKRPEADPPSPVEPRDPEPGVYEYAFVKASPTKIGQEPERLAEANPELWVDSVVDARALAEAEFGAKSRPLMFRRRPFAGGPTKANVWRGKRRNQFGPKPSADGDFEWVSLGIVDFGSPKPASTPAPVESADTIAEQRKALADSPKSFLYGVHPSGPLAGLPTERAPGVTYGAVDLRGVIPNGRTDAEFDQAVTWVEDPADLRIPTVNGYSLGIVRRVQFATVRYYAAKLNTSELSGVRYRYLVEWRPISKLGDRNIKGPAYRGWPVELGAEHRKTSPNQWFALFGKSGPVSPWFGNLATLLRRERRTRSVTAIVRASYYPAKGAWDAYTVDLRGEHVGLSVSYTVAGLTVYPKPVTPAWGLPKPVELAVKSAAPDTPPQAEADRAIVSAVLDPPWEQAKAKPKPAEVVAIGPDQAEAAAVPSVEEWPDEWSALWELREAMDTPIQRALLGRRPALVDVFRAALRLGIEQLKGGQDG